MGVLSGNQTDEPLHYGEVYAVWGYYAASKAGVATLQTYMNHTGDEDLRNLIDEMLRSSKPEIEQVETVLKENGIALPPVPPERPEASLEQIPAGARINDPEISAALSKNIAEGLVACSMAMGQATREDIAMMFGQFHLNKAQFGARMLRLNKEKGWLVTPPLHVRVPEPV